ncbi:MAG: hypothetical protein EA369_09485 [Bradymonadales bacterium]|nr:MAG: hypothetical protein EA369_09485 [Bradymonadales bacterium]
MKLPIYRKLDEPFKLMGLEPFELGVVAGVFVLSVQLLGATQYGLLLSLGGSSGLYLALIVLRLKFEPHCFRKWLRFSNLPDELHRKTFFS